MLLTSDAILAGDKEVAQAAQQRLLEVCRQVIIQAAQDSWRQTSQQTAVLHHGSDATSWEQVSKPWPCTV